MKGYGIMAAVVMAGLASAGTAAAQQAASQKAAKLGDAEIAAIVVAANAVDADMGEWAAERATQAEVKQFGKTMAADHRAVNQAAGELVGKLKVTPVDNALSKQLRADGAAVRAKLAAKSGAEFDRAYIAHEVEYHKAVIAAVDDLLIPSATNAELKQTIISVRPALVAHLQHAEKLLAGLK
jgi:putative membrane protein